MHEVVWNLHPETLASANNMAQMLQDLGEFQQAESFCREALEGKHATLGDTHPDTMAAIKTMHAILQAKSKSVKTNVLPTDTLVPKCPTK